MQTASGPVVNTYPTVAQSIGITGILIAAMLVFSPITIILRGFVTDEASTFVYYVITMGASILLINAIRKKAVGEDSFVLSVDKPRIIPVITVVTIALLFGIISPLTNLIPIPDVFKEAFKSIVSQRGILAFATMVIAAPIMEEIIFRGIMLEGLLRKYSPMKSILISSLLFGFVHLNPWQFIAGVVIGIFSGWVYYKTRSLMPSIIIHAAANLSSYIAWQFVDDIDKALSETMVESYGGMTNLIAVITGSIVIIWAGVYYLRGEFSREDGDGVVRS